MIAFLSNWLKEIVLLILIATFIDLLLPNRSMERYVKLVMGLLIILAILSPILSVLNKDLDFSELALSDGNNPFDDLASLESIHASGEELKQTQDHLVKEETQRRIAEQIAAEVDEEFQVTVLEKKVTMEEKPKGKFQIKQVWLNVAPKDSENRSKPIQPVEPIVIDSISEASPTKKEAAPQNELTQRISRYLQKYWELQPKQIQIQMADDV